MPDHPLAAHVDVMLFPDALAGAAFGLVDLLRAANTIAVLQHGDAVPRLGWRLVDAAGRPLRAGALPTRSAGPPRLRAARRALFVPPLHAHNLPALRRGLDALGAAVRHVGATFDAGDLVVTLGSGTWLAARSGRLREGRVVLPWFQAGGFRQDFPDVEVVAGRPWLHHGALLSGAEADTLGALGIELVRLAMGPALAQALANVHRHDPDRQQAAVKAAAQAHLGITRDSAVARAVAWLERHLDRPYRLADVAEAAAVSPRTLLRHFNAAHGRSPLDHLQGLRMQRARVLLELTLDTVPAIGEACGYADPAAFRRVFVRHAGVPPSQYRQRYALRSSRVRWKAEGV